jgi:hypothetical protein
MLRNQTEHGVMICFFTLQGLQDEDIDAELESVRGPEAPARSTMKKGRRPYQQGRTDLFHEPGPEGP